MRLTKNIFIKYSAMVLAPATILLLLTLTTTKSLAQGDVATPEISSSVNRVNAYVGDVVTFVVSIDADSTTAVAPLGIEEKLGDFEVQDIQISEPTKLENGRLHHRTTLKLWALATGEHQIPPVAVYYNNPGAKVDSLFTTSLTITVSSVVGEDEDSASIKPLRELLEDPLGLKQGFLYSRPFWGLLIGLALISGALFWWMKVRKIDGKAEWVDPRASWEIALDRLVELRNEPLLTQGLFKQYYSELTDTLREYLGAALDTHTLDMTTAELLTTLEHGSVTAIYKPQIASALSQADMIKFAKATPAAGRPEEDFETVYSVIVSIRNDITENRKKEEELQELLKAQNSPVAADTKETELTAVSNDGSATNEARDV